MLSFIPSPKLEKALRNFQAELVAESSLLQPLSPEEKKYLNRCALISNVGASTRIENAVLTDSEIEWVDTTLSDDGKTTAYELQKDIILSKLSKDRERSIEEVIGCRAVLSTIYQQATEMSPLTEMAIRGLHHELLRFYPAADDYAGAYKTVTNRVVSTNHATGAERVVLESALPGMTTELAMTDLVNWYNKNISESPWTLLVATEFMFRFLAIHPFKDGNGRLGRALFIMILLQSDDAHLADVASYVAIDRHIEQNKTQYYSVLYQASRGQFNNDPTQYQYQYEPVAWFFLKILQHALADINQYRLHYANLQKLSESALLILNSFKSRPEKRLKVAELETITGLPRRTIQYSLKTLFEYQFLQRTGQGSGVRYQLIF